MLLQTDTTNQWNLPGLSGSGIKSTPRDDLQLGDHLVMHRLCVEKRVPTLLIVHSRDTVPNRVKLLAYLWRHHRATDLTASSPAVEGPWVHRD